MPTLNNQECLELNADELEVTRRRCGEIVEHAKYLANRVNAGTLTQEMRKTLLSLLEFQIRDLSEALDYDNDLAREITERHAELRAANARIHELEVRLGAAGIQQLAVVKPTLRLLSENIRSWWREFGLGYVSDITYSEYGNAMLTFGLTISHSHLLYESMTPASDRQEFEQFKASLPYDLVSVHGDIRLLDNERNRELLVAMLTERFPSIYISKWHSWGVHEQPGVFTLWSVETVVYELDDLVSDV